MGTALIDTPQKVYRYFDEIEHAKDLARGRIWLSTFEYIRRCDRLRADPKEGTVDYNVQRAWWGSDGKPDAAAQVLEAQGLVGRAGMRKRVLIEGGTFGTRYADSYMLCATLQLDPKLERVFGKHKVIIHAPELLLPLVCQALTNAGVELQESLCGPAVYSGRQLNAGEQLPVPAPFACPEQNEWEREYRYVWRPKNLEGLAPRGLYIPELERICEFLN